MNEALKRANALKSKKPTKVIKPNKAQLKELKEYGYTPEDIEKPELELQSECETLITDLGLGFIRVDEKLSKLGKGRGVGNAFGPIRGLPDLCIFKKFANPTKILFVELKRPQHRLSLNGGLSQNQVNWRDRNAPTFIVYTYNEFYELIMDFHKGKYKVDAKR